MSAYLLTHAGRTYTPAGIVDVPPADVPAINADIEAADLAEWQTAPDAYMAYYEFPAEHLPLFGRPRPYRATFDPCLHTYVDNGTAHHAIITTGQNTTIGRIVSARVYTHNFGGRFVAITAIGTNGATYYGRASWDNGTIIRLRKATR